MKSMVASILLLLTALQPTSIGDTTAGAAAHAPDEIIVKFRKPVADAARDQIRANRAPAEMRLSRNLDTLNSRHRIRRIKQVFQHFRPRDYQHGESEQPLTKAQQRIRRRRQRASQNAKVPALDRIYRITLDPQSDESVEDILKRYRSDPDVEYAELNHIVRICREPNDPRYASQWALEKISAPEAWDIYTGSSDVIVAVIDTGVDYNHRDLAANMWVNQAERDGLSGIDDDENGYIDDVYGYNFVYNNPDPMDDTGHGTHCAGIIAAATDNALDTAGVCWNARIMALKFIGSEGEGTTADVVPAIYYAVANGADILSNSWGGDEESRLLEEALDFAHSQGVIVVAAAGNEGSDSPFYPAALDNVISVGASDTTDRIWTSSNFGSWVDLAAPGVNILSLKAGPGASTTTMSGTSMACPHVAGACAMLLSLNPHITTQSVYKIITTFTDPIENDDCCPDGRLNLRAAMAAAVPPKGYLTFDKDFYNSSSEIILMLADSDLSGTSTQNLTLYTNRGDSEIVTLTETDGAFGFFRAAVPTGTGEPVVDDGTIQIEDKDVVAAMYFDADNGSGLPAAIVADAVTDNTPPKVLLVDVDTKGPVAEIMVLSNEATSAQLRYATACGQAENIIPDSHTSPQHTFRLTPLDINTTYHFAVDLTDEAGNSYTADRNGLCYEFTTDANFPGFLVPGLYATIQDAIDAALDGDTIWVADGIYSGEGNYDIDFRAKAVTLRSENGPDDCIINCKSEGRAFFFHSGEDSNSVLDGFTIRGGRGGSYGGAIRCSASSPTITNCRFVENGAVEYGGAIHNSYGSNPIISNCTFYRNWTDSPGCKAGNGAAISNLVDCSPVITNCSFTQNSGDYGGGAIYNGKNSNPTITGCSFTLNTVGNPEHQKGFGAAICNEHNSSPVITNCRFEKNTSKYDAGAIYVSGDGHATVTSCIMINNTALRYGGAVKTFGGGITLENCTIVSNSAETGSAIWSGPSPGVSMSDSIIWANTDPNRNIDANQIFNSRPLEKIQAHYCSIQGAKDTCEGMGNIDADPLFVNPNAGDYHLMSTGWRWDSQRERWHYDFETSPCIDAGNPGRPLGDEPTTVPDDPDNLWAVNVRVNMGFYGRTAEASLAPHNWALLSDIDNDGAVKFTDYAILLQYWLRTEDDFFTDLDRDGFVGSADLSTIASDWLGYVKPPTVEITYPLDGAFFGDFPIDIPITARASDINGDVTVVEFRANGNVFALDNDPDDGWTANFLHPTGGIFDLTARAIDNGGAENISTPVQIRVIPPRH